MIIKIQLREQKFNMYLLWAKYRYELKSNDPKAWPLSFNIGDNIQWLDSKFIAHMLTQFNWVNTYGTQTAPHYV